MNNDIKSVDEYLSNLDIWKKNNLTHFRILISETGTLITEEIKWGVPVFILKGNIIFAEAAFKEHTKYNFIANGAQLKDNNKLFNNGFDSKKSRSIDLKENQFINWKNLKSLINESLLLAGNLS